VAEHRLVLELGGLAGERDPAPVEDEGVVGDAEHLGDVLLHQQQ
jgi:hypothetical protein